MTTNFTIISFIDLSHQGIFAPWKIIAWAFAGIVNDMIFVYNVLMLLVWFGLNILNCFGWVAIYSLYLELGDLSKIQHLARLKVKIDII